MSRSAEASSHEQALLDFYQTFKDIVGYGWTLDNNPSVEAALQFVITHSKETD